MDLKKLRSASFESKRDLRLPEGAVIVNKDYNLTVREIMNGYVVHKSWNIEYTIGDGDEINHEWYSEEYYSKTNPMTIDFKEKSIADKL